MTSTIVSRVRVACSNVSTKIAIKMLLFFTYFTGIYGFDKKKTVTVKLVSMRGLQKNL